jgi:hypothetical protein
LSIDPVVTDANTGGSFNRYAYAANNPYKYIDPDGRDIMVIAGGQRDESPNVLGHIAGAVEGNGMSSFGNDTPRGSSVLQYLVSQGAARDQQVTIIPTTPAQTAAAAGVANSLPSQVGILDNCAVRTNQIMSAAGIAVSSVPLPKVTATVAAGQPGAITYGIPQGTAIPAALAKILSKFDPPKKNEPPPPPKKEESKQ